MVIESGHTGATSNTDGRVHTDEHDRPGEDDHGATRDIRVPTRIHADSSEQRTKDGRHPQHAPERIGDHARRDSRQDEQRRDQENSDDSDRHQDCR